MSRKKATPGIQRRDGPRGPRYRSRVELPAVDGKRRWETRTFGSLDEAKKHQVSVRAAIFDGSAESMSTFTLSQFCETLWLPYYQKHFRSSSLRIRQTDLNMHILPLLGHIRLRHLTTVAIQQMLDSLTVSHKPNTVASIRSTINTVLNRAVAWNLLPRNPATGTRVPPAEKRPYTFWTDEQFQTFLAHEDNPDWYVFWQLLAVSGMRIAECLALRWDDIDINSNAIRIERTLTRDEHNVWHVGPVKTRASRRIVAIPPPLCVQLADVYARQHERRTFLRSAWHDPAYCFDRGDGDFQTPYAPQARLEKITKAAKLPRVRLHDFRHGNATIQLEAGVPLSVIRERLGHSSITITGNLYAHVTDRLNRQAAQVLEDRLLKGTAPCHVLISRWGG